MNNSSSLYHYKLYGLHVASEIELTELIVSSEQDNIDVLIIKKSISAEIKQAQINNIHYHFSTNDIWYEVEGLGTYHIKNGTSIEVDYDEDKDFQLVKGYLLGTAFGCLIAQREQVAFHGGTIVMNHGAIIVTGESGAGKSTLTTALRNQGYGFLADDVSVTTLNHANQCIVQPAFPQQKLCRDAMIQMGYTPNNYIKVDEERDKYLLPVKQQFINHAIPLTCIIEIAIGTTLQLNEIKGKEKLKILFRNIYRCSIWEHLSMPSNYFKRCLMIAKQIPVYQLQRPDSEYTIDEQIMLLIKVFQDQKKEHVV